MQYSQIEAPAPAPLMALFQQVFSDSEGPDEGAVVGALVGDLLRDTPAGDLMVFVARDGDALAGCILATRMRYADDPREVFLVAPVAVATSQQGHGVGQALLRFGLERLRAAGVDVAMTYGDPAYYGRVGFKQITEAQAASPQPMQMPQGWQAQALDGGPLAPLRGAAQCVAGFDRPELW